MQQNPWDLPEPEGVERVKGVRPWRSLIIVVVAAAIFVLSLILPVPIFYAYEPGPVRDVTKLVEIEDAPTYSSEGKLMLTTVAVDLRVTFSEWFGSLFDPSRTIILKEQLTQGRSLQELQKQEALEMRMSKQHAIEVIAQQLGFGRPTGDGAEVVATLKDTPAEGTLEPGDRIVEIDGQKVSTTCDVGAIVGSHRVGDEVAIGFLRGGERRSVEVALDENPQAPGNPFIGISMKDVNYHFEPGIEVNVDTGQIGGPSAGLMLSLAVYDRLTPEDLTAGRVIAGTGTIDCDGGVGPIGGVEQKVAGAESMGAEIFLAPVVNAEAARRVADDIKVVSIASFADALRFLEGLE